MSGHRLPTIYWINLERSTGRRRRMEERLSARGLSHVRISAVDAQDPAATARALLSRAPTITEAACMASHLRAIKAAFESGASLAIVMEDDITFEPYDAWTAGYATILAALPDPFSACCLCVAETPRALDALFRRPELIVPLGRGNYWSMGATLYHRSGMEALLRRYDRGEAFDIRDFRGRHDAYQLLMRSLQPAGALPEPYVARIPLFLYEGEDSEIHPHHLPEHRVALAYLREHYPALLAQAYVSPFTWRARLARLGALFRSRAGARE
jgi:hypothetical protein